MDFSKLTQGHVYIIGLVVALLLGVAFYFLGPHRTRQNLTAWNGQLTSYQQVIQTEASKKEALEQAKRDVIEKQALWARIERTKMPRPPIDLSDSSDRGQTLAMIRLWNEPRTTVPLMERFALNTDDVIVTTNFGLPGQPTNPRAIPQQVIEWPLGTVTVQGSFDKIINYFKRWNQAPRLVAVDGFSLQGTSPFLTATANITVYIFPKPNPQAQQQQPGGFGGFGGAYGGPGAYPGGVDPAGAGFGPAGGYDPAAGYGPAGGGVPPGYGPGGGAAGVTPGPPS